MPNQPPSDRTRAKGRPPIFNPGLSAGDPPPHKKCETNPIPTYQVSRSPLFQRNEPNFQPRRTCGNPKMRNEPNPSLAHDPKMRNEPNFPHRWRLAGLPSPPIMRNEPNFHPATPPNAQNEPNYRPFRACNFGFVSNFVPIHRASHFGFPPGRSKRNRCVT